MFSLSGFLKGLLIQDPTDKSKQLSVEVSSSATTDTRMTVQSAQTADRTLNLPDISDTLVGKETSDILENKTMDFSTSGTNSIVADAIDILYDNTSSGLSATELQGAVDEVDTNIETVATNLSNHIADATDAHDASAISNVPAGTISSTDLQSAINELDGDNQTTSSALSAHISDATDAHDASAISNIPSGNLSATDIQSAVNELQTDIDTRATTVALNAHINDVSAAHTASAIANVPSGNLVATDVQGALNEIQTELDAFAGGGVNVYLSNLSTPVAINQDLVFGSSVSGILQTLDEPAGATTGMTVQSGNSSTSISGALEVRSGAADISSGTATLSSGNGSGTDTTTGDVNLISGNATGTGNSGNLVFTTGSVVSGTRGQVKIVDGSEGVAGQVWTSTDTVGTGTWSTNFATRVWGTFNGATSDNVSGTYTRVGTLVTITITNHGHKSGHGVYCNFTSGTAVDGFFSVVTVIDANTFTVIHGTSGNTSGNITLERVQLNDSGNINSISRTSASAGQYCVNFEDALSDDAYATFLSGWSVSGGASSAVFELDRTLGNSSIRVCIYTASVSSTLNHTFINNDRVTIMCVR